jgi:hypothetical protein
MLAEVLYDDPEFKLVKKDKLMKELHEKLDRLKAVGDTYLEQFFPQCDFETCCADTWLFMTFIGNRSFKHFDLVLQFAKEGITEIKIGMPYCLNKAIGLEIHKAGKMPVEFFTGELLEEHFYSFNLEAGLALLEIETASASDPLSLEYTNEWLETYRMLSSYLENVKIPNLKNLGNFVELYNQLIDLRIYEAEAEEAMIAYKLANDTPNFLISWLCQNEVLILDVLGSRLSLFKNRDTSEESFFYLSPEHPIRLQLKDYMKVLEFYYIVDKLYFQVFNRIKKFSTRECEAIAEKEGTETRVYYLSYHLGMVTS